MIRFSRPLLLALCLPALPFAADGITLGGGLNSSFTSVKNKGTAESTNRPGFNLGIGYEKEFGPFAYVPELNIETRGETAFFPDGYFGRDATSRLQLLYLQIPVFLFVKIPVGRGALDLFAGPALGILLSAKIEDDIEDRPKTTRDVKDDSNPLDFGVEFGTGLELPAGSGTLFLRPSCYLGMTEIERDSDSGAKLRNFKLKLGFKFPV